MIQIRHLRKEYPNAVPLKDVSVDIHKGDVISVIGPSGTGKSTLIRCLNMLDVPTSGQIIVNGTEITKKGCHINEVRKKMGMVFQSFNLFDHLTVLENVMYPPIHLLNMPRQEAYDWAMTLLHMVGMDGRALNYPDMLSGGQKQRVAIARTLSMDPDVILFDEPTSALDPTMVGEVRAVIRELAKTGTTMIIVTHEMKFAREICNRVFYMDEGGIYEDGSPEQVFDHPQKEKTRQFVRQLKTFQVTVTEKDFDYVGTVSSLDTFGYKNQIPGRIVRRLRSAFEELCRQILAPVPDISAIEFTVEYEEAVGAAHVLVRYDGPEWDPRQTDNALALQVLEGLAPLTHTKQEENGYTNLVTLEIQ